MSKIISVHIRQCARCGEDHDDLEFKPLTIPVRDNSEYEIDWTHWALCPKLGEPILMRLILEHTEEA